MSTTTLPLPDRDLLTVRQAARRARISERRLRQLIADGDLPAYTAGCRTWRRVLWPDVLAWLRSTRVTPQEPRDAA